jgi:hypothetical protein
MIKFIMRILLILVISAVSGVVGLVIGAIIGGNFATQTSFNGVQGYEATGQIGSIIGFLSGLVISGILLLRKKRFRG